MPSLFATFLALLIALSLILLPAEPWSTQDFDYFSKGMASRLYVDADTRTLTWIFAGALFVALMVQIQRGVRTSKLNTVLDAVQVHCNRPWIVVHANRADTMNRIFITQRCRQPVELSSCIVRLVCKERVQVQDQQGQRTVMTVVQNWQLPVIRLLHSGDERSRAPPHMVLCSDVSLQCDAARHTSLPGENPQFNWSLEGELYYTMNQMENVCRFSAPMIVVVEP